MGDRYDRHASILRRRNGGTMRPPDLILNWGLVPAQKPEPPPAPVGHNGGPPIAEPVDTYLRYAWTMAHRAAWKNPPMDILRFRVARAEAAGVSYETYMSTLLDTGRHLQKGDVPATPSEPVHDPAAHGPKSKQE